MKVGIQLYSVRESMAKDPRKTIEEVSKLGYKYLEFANSTADTDPGVGFLITVDEMKELLKTTGTQIISAHISPLNLENIDSVLDYHSRLGTKFLVYPMEMFESEEQTKEFAKKLNTLGEKAREKGISLLYHNHFQEFFKVNGRTFLDIIIENTSKENLGLQMDTYWAVRGGEYPLEVLKKYGTRVKLIHQKDYPDTAKDSIIVPEHFRTGEKKMSMEDFMPLFSKEYFTEIGQGVMDIQAIINTAKEYCDSKYIILEQDLSSHSELESIKISMEQFEKFQGIDFT